MDLVLVAAIGDNNVIGRGGQLPWHIRSDLQHFKRLTINRPVVMGRHTFECRKASWTHQHCAEPRLFRACARSHLPQVSTRAGAARSDARKRASQIMVIGGSTYWAHHAEAAGRDHPWARLAGRRPFSSEIDRRNGSCARSRSICRPHDDPAFATQLLPYLRQRRNRAVPRCSLNRIPANTRKCAREI